MSKCRWRKVLYERQSFPDNYVDPGSFLSALQRRSSSPRPQLRQCLLTAGRLTQEVALCCLCPALFVWLDETHHPDLLPAALILSTLTLSLISLAFWDPSAVMGTSRTGSVFLLFGFGFSPILKNLTETISTDTIYAMVSLAYLLHLFVQDYGVRAAFVSPTLAFNAALFAAVCLASRLQTILQAFTLLTFSAVIFAGAPLLHRLSSRSSLIFQVTLTSTVAVSALTSLAVLFSWSSCLLLLCLLLFLNGLCPVLFVHCQKYKDNIFGPWDEAVVHSDTVPPHS